MLYSHNHYTYTYACRNIFNTITTSRHSFLEKYTSHFTRKFKRVTKGFTVWEVSWRLNRTATYWPPPFWLSQPFFAVLLDCSTGGLGAQLLLGHGSHSSIFSPTDLNFLSPGLYNNLTPTYFLRVSQFTLSSTPRQSMLLPDIPRPDSPVIYTGAFLLLTAWPGSIYNITSCKRLSLNKLLKLSCF